MATITHSSPSSTASVLQENVAPSESVPQATDIETVFTELLAEVLHVDGVSSDSHFFDDLGADSLVMAHFCAKVRKRGNLPPVSMRDVYQYPTIRKLTAALAEITSETGEPQAPATNEPSVPTSNREYIICGALQGIFF